MTADSVFINYTGEGMVSFIYPVVTMRNQWLTVHSEVFRFPSDHLHDHWARVLYGQAHPCVFELIGFHATLG